MSEATVKFDGKVLRAEADGEVFELDVNGEAYVSSYTDLWDAKYEVEGLTDALYEFIEEFFSKRRDFLTVSCVDWVIYSEGKDVLIAVHDGLYFQIHKITADVGYYLDRTEFRTPIGTFIEELSKEEYRRRAWEFASDYRIFAPHEGRKVKVEGTELQIYDFKGKLAFALTPEEVYRRCDCITGAIPSKIFDQWLLNVVKEMFETGKYEVTNEGNDYYFRYGILKFWYNRNEGLKEVSGNIPYDFYMKLKEREREVSIYGGGLGIVVNHSGIRELYQRLTGIFDKNFRQFRKL